eukprot:MONOS_2385.1-p1 / transcript=MONOS_2385.1 / gene=MONOS_2385 / organism=Monocercomonoides_exilis_PA203 / gene_product=unspecified product / transcript_product=unspecified product / location=Mono_scaffold00049:40415-43241(-) / protein_length=913 / sequence_SO=supercontig / SO=protein_coding / is_pseudo=false
MLLSLNEQFLKHPKKEYFNREFFQLLKYGDFDLLQIEVIGSYGLLTNIPQDRTLSSIMRHSLRTLTGSEITIDFINSLIDAYSPRYSNTFYYSKSQSAMDYWLQFSYLTRAQFIPISTTELIERGMKFEQELHWIASKENPKSQYSDIIRPPYKQPAPRSENRNFDEHSSNAQQFQQRNRNSIFGKKSIIAQIPIFEKPIAAFFVLLNELQNAFLYKPVSNSESEATKEVLKSGESPENVIPSKENSKNDEKIKVQEPKSITEIAYEGNDMSSFIMGAFNVCSPSLPFHRPFTVVVCRVVLPSIFCQSPSPLASVIAEEVGHSGILKFKAAVVEHGNLIFPKDSDGKNHSSWHSDNYLELLVERERLKSEIADLSASVKERNAIQKEMNNNDKINSSNIENEQKSLSHDNSSKTGDGSNAMKDDINSSEKAAHLKRLEERLDENEMLLTMQLPIAMQKNPTTAKHVSEFLLKYTDNQGDRLPGVGILSKLISFIVSDKTEQKKYASTIMQFIYAFVKVFLIRFSLPLAAWLVLRVIQRFALTRHLFGAITQNNNQTMLWRFLNVVFVEEEQSLILTSICNGIILMLLVILAIISDDFLSVSSPLSRTSPMKTELDTSSPFSPSSSSSSSARISTKTHKTARTAKVTFHAFSKFDGVILVIVPLFEFCALFVFYSNNSLRLWTIASFFILLLEEFIRFRSPAIFGTFHNCVTFLALLSALLLILCGIEGLEWKMRHRRRAGEHNDGGAHHHAHPVHNAHDEVDEQPPQMPIAADDGNDADENGVVHQFWLHEENNQVEQAEEEEEEEEEEHIQEYIAEAVVAVYQDESHIALLDEEGRDEEETNDEDSPVMRRRSQRALADERRNDSTDNSDSLPIRSDDSDEESSEVGTFARELPYPSEEDTSSFSPQQPES